MTVRKSTKTSIIIEDEPSQPEEKLHASLIFLYGPPKIGKSEFFSHFTDPYYIQTEPGLKWLNVRKTYVKNWSEFKELLTLLEKRISSGKFTASYIVVDTVDNLFRFCLEYVCDVRKIDHPSDQAYGKGWEALGREWNKGIGRVVTLMPDVGVGFVGHSTVRETKKHGIVIEKIMPEMSRSGFRTLNALCDFILYAGVEERRVRKVNGKKVWRQKRFLYTRPTEDVETGARGPQFPEKVPFDYANFKEYF